MVCLQDCSLGQEMPHSGAAANTPEAPGTCKPQFQIHLARCCLVTCKKCKVSAGLRQTNARPHFEAHSAWCPICPVYCKDIQGAARRWKSAGLRKPFSLDRENHSHCIAHLTVRGSEKVPLREVLTHPASPVLLEQPESYKALGSKGFSPSNTFVHQQFSLRRV